MKKTAILALLLAGMWGAGVSAQPAQKLFTVVLSPDRTDWQCKAKEEVTFNVQVFKHENLLEGVTVDYELGPECFPTVTKQDVVLPTGKTTLKASMKEPGFLRWILRSDFPDEVKKIASDALSGIFPERSK